MFVCVNVEVFHYARQEENDLRNDRNIRTYLSAARTMTTTERVSAFATPKKQSACILHIVVLIFALVSVCSRS